jgi:5'-methylthioadenosine phosphorylase
VERPIGILGGTSLREFKLISHGKKENVTTQYGVATVFVADKIAYIDRHLTGIPPHRINHHANIAALKKYAKNIVGVSSTGSLREELKPPKIVVPHDYINLNPPTYYDGELSHITPELDDGLRDQIIKAAKKQDIPVIPGGVYYQSRGPRLETRAEVSMLSRHADIVGMTCASEATLAVEAGLKYAMLCSVDNLANGLSDKPLDYCIIKDSAAESQKTIEKILETLIMGLK